MKQKLHQITAFSLALIVLVSSVSFTVNKHICGGKVANTTLFVSADNCGMDMAICETKPASSKSSLEKEPCCKDVSEFVQGNDIPQQALQVTSLTKSDFVFQLVNAYVAKATRITTEKQTLLRFYRPPTLLKKHRQDFLQVFRI
jgi:hypothetical protein